MTSRGRRAGCCLEPQVASVTRSNEGAGVQERERSWGASGREKGQAGVLPRGEPGAWASATAGTSVSVRGSDPPPTTSTEGGRDMEMAAREHSEWSIERS
jgi:hypothetical protein